MARGHSKKWKRDPNAISNQRLRSFKKYPPRFTSKAPLGYGLRAYEDRRTFHPEGATRPAGSFSQSRHRLVTTYPKTKVYIRAGLQTPVYTKKLFDTVPVGVGFRTPYKVLICVRRQQRREVLFATKNAGRNGSRERHLNEYSGVHC